MSKEKQLEEIARILASNCGDCGKCACYRKEINGIDACYFKYAKMVYNAGYRKQSEVAAEIFAEIEKIIQKNYDSAQNNEEDEELEAATDYLSYVSCDLYELKDKYIGAGENAELDAPADVFEVVRCKDCAVPHNKWTGCPNLNGLVPPPDFYCAKGERKVGK